MNQKTAIDGHVGADSSNSRFGKDAYGNRPICKTRKARTLVRSMGWAAEWISPEVLADMHWMKEKQNNLTEIATSTVRDVSRRNRKTGEEAMQ